jgi:UDP-3-O-[3-hydroxymyristoyl] N-acetylglucosamine deacetylase
MAWVPMVVRSSVLALAKSSSSMNQPYQQTIANSFSLSGVGLHSGEVATVSVKPAPSDRGRYFVIDNQEIPARIEAVGSTVLSTELQAGGQSIRTVEHLLSALFALGVDNACIELKGHELPILDGSAMAWAEAISKVGVIAQDRLRTPVQLTQPLIVQKNDGFVMAVPANQLKFTCGIEFQVSAIATQWYSWQPHLANFAADFIKEIAPARTFTLASQVEALRAANLIKGGSLENAIVCDDKGWLNPPLRFDNEPCRHKLLDLIGDLSLIGTLPAAHYLAYKASHALHTQFIRTLNQNLSSNPE